MALVSAMTGRDWNRAGTGLADPQTASRDPYWAFADATKQLGFEAMLTRHRWGLGLGQTGDMLEHPSPGSGPTSIAACEGCVGAHVSPKCFGVEAWYWLASEYCVCSERDVSD